MWEGGGGLLGFGGVEVGLFDVFEVAVGLNLELGAGVFVADDYGVAVHLQGADCPHLGDAAFYAVTQGAGLVVAVDDEHNLFGGHHCAYADGEGGLGYEVDVVLEEARVGDDGVLGEGLHAGLRCQRRARLVEGDVSVGAYAAHEQVDAAVRGDLGLVALTFGNGVLGVAVEDVDVFGLDVNLVEEVGPHKSVVALLVVAGNAHVLVHVEGDDVFERYLAFLVEADEGLVHAQGRRAGGAAEHEGVLGGGVGGVDAGCHKVGGPFRNVGVVGFDD